MLLFLTPCYAIRSKYTNVKFSIFSRTKKRKHRFEYKIYAFPFYGRTQKSSLNTTLFLKITDEKEQNDLMKYF